MTSCQTLPFERLTQASTVTPEETSSEGESGATTYEVSPSNDADVLRSPVKASPVARPTLLYVAGLTPVSSAAVVPLDSPSRQNARGLSAMIAARYADGMLKVVGALNPMLPAESDCCARAVYV
jgi:hypothetical protein